MRFVPIARRTVALLGVLFLISACGQNGHQAANGGAPGEIVLHWGNAAEPGTLDPDRATGQWEANIIGNMLMGLTTENVDGQPIPGVATRWDTSDDGLTWTFHLRDETWSDGVPVTADDFVYAWRRILDPKFASVYAYFLDPIKNAAAVNAGKMPPSALGVEAPDAHTLVVHLEHPAPYLPQFMMHNTTYPVPKHVVEKLGDAWTKPGNYVSNGPYILKDWIPNDHVTLVKNPKFYDAANVKIDRVIYYPTGDYDAALRRFRAGELDIQASYPQQQIDWIRANIPQDIDLKPVLSTEYFLVNFARKPFGDVRVRQALSLALNRKAIIDKVMRIPEIPPAYSIVPPGIVNFPHDNALPAKTMPFPERLKKAQALMRAAGYGPDHPLKTTLAIRSAAADARRVPAAVQEMWKQIYVDVELQQSDTAIFYKNVEQHNFDIAESAWGADFNDASNFLDLLHTGNPNNSGQYHNAAFDGLLDRAKQERDAKKRGQLLAQAEAIALKDYAWIPFYFWVSPDLVHPYVKGWVTDANDIHRARWLSIDEAARKKALNR